MKNRNKIALVAGGLAAGAAAVLGAGSRRWTNSTFKELEVLHESSIDQRSQDLIPEGFTEHQLENLPAPVRTYLAFALQPGQRAVTRAALQQTGKFRTLSGEAEGEWSTFKANEFFTTSPPGFVWDASIHITPMLPTRVRDSFTVVHGNMEARLAGLVPVASEADSPELNAGQLHRYLSEAVWFPTALLTSSDLTWEGLDERTARATLRSGGTRVSLDFTFGAQGEITSAYAAERYRGINGRYELTPWRTLYSQYRLRNGMKIPYSAEVEWIINGVRRPYCHVQVIDIEHEFSGRRLAA